ncbi:hemagglutinin repeat-containing protein, partial [Caballeronia sp. GAWG2-1]|uniref:hemagglutinin repeat-containing protein n=1 Tax=Caballeronia sp. GAWG2-1 TaxID=2921744 RepID=UPI00202808E7
NSQETHSHSNVVSGKEVASSSNSTATLSQGSMISADAVTITSGKDINVQGSTIVGTNDVSLNATHDVNITTTQDTMQSSGSHQETRTGLGTSGLTVTVGTNKLATTDQASSVTNNASTVGSINGDLSIQAGNTLHVTGSDLVAGGNLAGTAANVIIDAATDTSHQAQTQKTSSSGVTLGLAGSVGDAINNAYSESQAIGHSASSGNDRAAALHSIAAVGDAAMVANGAKALAGGGKPDIGVKVSIGSSKSQSQSSEDQATQRGSSVQAGGTVAFVATGDGTPGSGNVTIAGSNVGANDVSLAAKNQVNIVNTTDTDSTRSSNSSSSASIGVQYTLGSGYGVSAAMANAHGDANSDASIQNASHVTGANSVTVISGGDTNIIGSQLNGKQIAADVGGNLNITSVQDVTNSAAHQSSAGGGVTISQGGGSASFSAQNGHADSNYQGVNEQAGINAGDGGFNVNVKGSTGLTGAVISSTADASKNSLTTGTLTYSDIQNQSHYDANSNGISAGVGVGVTGKATGPGSVSGSGGATPMISQNESGDSSATTRSAVSAGTIDITNASGQTQDVAGLSRDTTNTNGTVAKTPDVSAILNQQADTMQAAQAAGQVVAQGIGAYADMKRDEAVDAVDAAAKSDDPQALAAALADYADWREGGDSRAILQAGGGALIGGLGGGAFSAFGGAAGAAISSKLADQTKAAADAVTGATGSSLMGNLAGNILSGLAGAAVGGTAGAAMGSNVNLYNQGNDKDAAAKDSRVKAVIAQALGNPPDFNAISLGTLIDQFVGLMKSGAQAKMSESPADLMAQGAANGLNAIVGTGGGKPPAASPGVVLADSTAANAVPGTPGYVPGNAIFNGSNNGESGNNSLLDPKAETHVLYGDGPTSGGHLSGVGKPGKSEFPPSWSPQDVTNAISDIATDPKTQWSKPSSNGYVTGTGTVDGVDIKVVVDPSRGRIVTGYPTNLPKNPK